MVSVLQIGDRLTDVARKRASLPLLGGCLGVFLLVCALVGFGILTVHFYGPSNSDQPLVKVIKDFKAKPETWVGIALAASAYFVISIGFLCRQTWAWFGCLFLEVGHLAYSVYAVSRGFEALSTSNLIFQVLLCFLLVLPSVRRAFFGARGKI